ncbi:phage terminase small subunit [Paenibacillus taichungensis]|uniref:phage terminase small subunit n=1 Tax=Paenibacillus taichungensis TaxID=484184 RepID=UPI002DBB45CF|nr:phage terminase small subunit [Paenibacillus taichungensis]MEC0107255.1 phage terminase small subunit [Paenibacillus taichungensis]MEC0194813.1 phage terminase small subunit [Paenibacillus taichungensis]
MSRQPSEIRKKAKQIWLRSKRKKKPKEIAEQLGVSPSLVRKWKSIDRWEDTPEERRIGAPLGNKNAVGNKGGPGGPKGNDHAVSHGLFRRFMPDDEETREIFDEAAEMSPLDIMIGMIQIKVTNILRAQRIMFVRDQEDETKVIKKQKREMEVVKEKVNGESRVYDIVPTYIEEEYDIQHAWDKQGKAMTSQAAAMRELRSLIKQYDEMLRQADPSEVSEKRKAEMELLKSQVKVMQSKEW